MEIEDKLKELIQSRYRSILDFAKASGMPYGTIRSIFERGIMNSSVTTIIKLCQNLQISTDDLVMGRIVHTDRENTEGRTVEIDGLIKYARNNHDEYEYLTIDDEPITDPEYQRILDAIEVAVGMIARDRRKRR